MATLIFRVSGIMQGFGAEGGTRAYHFCSSVPAKKSIVGLLSAALGYRKNSKEISDLYDSIDVNVHTEKVGNSMWDFQAVHHLNDHKYGKDGHRIKYQMQTAGGGSFEGPIINKEYRTEADYTVNVIGEDSLIEQIAKAMEKPYYPLFLGKACCLGRISVLEVTNKDEC